MDIQDVRDKWKRNNKLLFTRESACLQELLSLIRLQSRKTLALWALTCVQQPIDRLKERYPADTRPEAARLLSIVQGLQISPAGNGLPFCGRINVQTRNSSYGKRRTK